jgi:molecular chaperone GrpE
MKNKKIVSKENINKRKATMEEKATSGNKTADMNDNDTTEFPCDQTEKDQLILDQKVKIDELNDKYLRLYAEFDNYRKRAIKERLELIKTASAEIILSLLPVLDDYERAISAIPDDESFKAVKDGVILIYNKYKAILVKKGLEEIKAIGEAFDTDLHEAIAQVPAIKDDQKGKIVDVTEKGYYLNGVVLRFAKVVVAN